MKQSTNLLSAILTGFLCVMLMSCKQEQQVEVDEHFLITAGSQVAHLEDRIRDEKSPGEIIHLSRQADEKIREVERICKTYGKQSDYAISLYYQSKFERLSELEADRLKREKASKKLREKLAEIDRNAEIAISRSNIELQRIESDKKIKISEAELRHHRKVMADILGIPLWHLEPDKHKVKPSSDPELPPGVERNSDEIPIELEEP